MKQSTKLHYKKVSIVALITWETIVARKTFEQLFDQLSICITRQTAFCVITLKGLNSKNGKHYLTLSGRGVCTCHCFSPSLKYKHTELQRTQGENEQSFHYYACIQRNYKVTNAENISKGKQQQHHLRCITSNLLVTPCHPTVIPRLIQISRLVPKGCNFLSRMADKELLS